MSTEFSLTLEDSTSALPQHVDPLEQLYQRVKVDIHQKLVESLEPTQLDKVKELPKAGGELHQWAVEVCKSQAELAAGVDNDRLANELPDEVFGLGPLEPLMQDPTISDILVNDPYSVYIERNGRLELTNRIFADEAHLVRVIQRIVGRLGRRIDETSPMVDARLPDGSRVNAIIPPLAINGPSLSIRRFGINSLQMGELLALGSLTPEIGKFLAAAVRSRIAMLISGGTGAGKTTLLNALSAFIPMSERTITIEDSAELKLQRRHWIRLEVRPPNTEGVGEVTQRDLVRNSLRMRPDRIIVGEVRGAEVWDMLQAMNTGHDGSLTTIHANTTPDALARLEMMVAQTGFEMPIPVVRHYVASGMTLVVQLSRLAGGPRRVMRVSELLRVEGDNYVMEDIFGFEQTDVDAAGVAQGHFYATGYRPACMARMEAAGIKLPDEMFQVRQIVQSRSSSGGEP
jgi:pilus assembly protein CpaF